MSDGWMTEEELAAHTALLDRIKADIVIQEALAAARDEIRRDERGSRFDVV